MIFALFLLSLVFAGAFKQVSDMAREGKLAYGSWWDGTTSWLNKYSINPQYNPYALNGEPKYKPKFFGSTTFLVFVTDAFHFFSMLTRLSWGLAITMLSLLAFPDWIWWEYVLFFISIVGSSSMSGYYTRKLLK